jgi:hypothetical protein
MASAHCHAPISSFQKSATPTTSAFVADIEAHIDPLIPHVLVSAVAFGNRSHVLPGPPNNANLLTMLGPISSYSALV